LVLIFGLASLNAQTQPGTLDESFSPVLNTGCSVLALQVDASDRIILGGIFTNVDGRPRTGVARLNRDGTLDEGFLPLLTNESGSSPLIRALLLGKNDRVLIGGRFSHVNGIARQGLAALNSDGSLDTDFDSGREVDFAIRAAFTPDEKVVVINLSGSSTFRVVRLNHEGSLDPTFQITNTFNGIVESVAVEPSGKILVGGGFDINTGNVLRQFVVRFHETGALDEEFRPQLPITGYGYVSVVSIIVQPDSRVLLGKYMLSGAAHPYARNSVDRIFTDGILDTSFYT